ncbi:MAG TPA: hypothetical protein VEF06_03195, partial [Bryobacteraceae bacterium]|nr:hypothetical protein [Bryobacteraceae bacterium]
RFRHTLAGCTVTIHEHPDGNISIRYGPHVVGRYDKDGERRGKVESQKRASHFPTATAATAALPKTKPRRLAPPENPKADRSRVNPSGQIDLLTTADLRNFVGVAERSELRDAGGQ